MKKHHESDEIQIEARRALIYMATGDSTNQQVLVEAGVASIIVTSLKKLTKKGSSTHLCDCILLLIVLAENSDECRIAIAKTGAIAAIVALLKQYAAATSEAPLLLKCCQALSFLGLTTVNQALLVQDGAASAMIEVLKKHGDDESVQSECWAVLRCMVVEATNLKQMDAELLLNSIVATMKTKKFQTHSNIQEHGCFIISCLSEGTPASRASVAKLALPVVVTAMKAHADFADLQTYACRAIGNLGGLNADASTSSLVNDSGTLSPRPPAFPCSSHQCMVLIPSTRIVHPIHTHCSYHFTR